MFFSLYLHASLQPGDQLSYLFNFLKCLHSPTVTPPCKFLPTSALDAVSIAFLKSCYWLVIFNITSCAMSNHINCLALYIFEMIARIVLVSLGNQKLTGKNGTPRVWHLGFFHATPFIGLQWMRKRKGRENALRLNAVRKVGQIACEKSG